MKCFACKGLGYQVQREESGYTVYDQCRECMGTGLVLLDPINRD